jgi:hypothetical protein
MAKKASSKKRPAVKKPLKKKSVPVKKKPKIKKAPPKRSFFKKILRNDKKTKKAAKPVKAKKTGKGKKPLTRTFIHYPLQLQVGKKFYLLNNLNFGSGNFKRICDEVKKAKEATFLFNSSQAPNIFEKIYKIIDIFIKDISQKIDPLLREIVKNAEKENATVIAKKAGLIDQKAFHAPLEMMRGILNETLMDKASALPLLYYFRDVHVKMKMSVSNNNLNFDIENAGEIRDVTRRMIVDRIELGKSIALFDLQQEFEMKRYEQIRDKIKVFFLLVFKQDKLDELWKKTFDESFDDYWSLCPYFIMINEKVHSSFFPHFLTAYYLLNSTFMQDEHPDEANFSAGMGYIKCAFVLEANRNLYGTYGKVLAPANKGKKTHAVFYVGMPKIDINFNALKGLKH